MAVFSGFRARQPGKTLWLLVAIVHLAFVLLSFSIYYLPIFTRSNAQWSYRNSLTNKLIKVALRHITYLKLLLPLSMEPGAEKEFFVLITPNKKIYKGDLAGPVIPGVIGATWYPQKPREGKEFQKTAALHFHGGSFIFGSGRQAECAKAAALLTDSIVDSAIFVQYRLAGDPACPFPAAIQDAVTAYSYLIDLGIPASQIIISGDSAGGNIAVALLRYISLEKGILPSPGGCALWSPSIDLATQNPNGIDLHRNFKTDYLSGSTLAWGIGLYIPKSMDLMGPWFSPLRHPFATKVPIWMMTGVAEVLTDTIVEFASRMKDIAGNRIGLYEVQNAPHDIFLVGDLMG
ncbi:Esterase [Lachnellula suecica]|uniref:Esterase n=1 Tax=Lachnellula suecica TaxID=602035 RepID=A0A8T9CI08_9HELO|nr:Esterase [Lachnellula suecica]